MSLGRKDSQGDCRSLALSRKLWLYTNFDCNLRCSYCVTKSTPTSPRLALGLENVQQLADQVVALGFCDLFFTGGEPFMLDEIYEMLAYASARVRTTVLTNGTLLSGKRLDKLCAMANDNLWVQVSLDGGHPGAHDAYRGQGTWVKAVASIKDLLARGIHVCISTTETPANSMCMNELHTFRRELGIPDKDHLVRPLAKHGFSQEGLEVGRDTLAPEVTVTAGGIYWHPLTFPGNTEMQVREEIFPLIDAITCIERELGENRATLGASWTEFT